LTSDDNEQGRVEKLPKARIKLFSELKHENTNINHLKPKVPAMIFQVDPIAKSINSRIQPTSQMKAEMIKGNVFKGLLLYAMVTQSGAIYWAKHSKKIISL
jgi:hypothetical protein